MIIFLAEQFVFLLTLIITLVLPGYLCLSLLFGQRLSFMEKSIFSVPVSFAITSFLMLGLHYAEIPLIRSSIISFELLLVTAFALGISYKKSDSPEDSTARVKALSKKGFLIFLMLSALMLTVKGIYLKNTIFPTATDLGHHMFWVEKISQSGKIHPYKKTVVESLDPNNASETAATFSGIEHIPDFIVGEHLVFAAIAIIAGHSTVSAFPSLVLFIVHLVSIYGLFALARRMFASQKYGENASLWTLALIGPLYAISGAQAKFVSGGVVGNVLGNMLIVGIIFFLYRALKEKSRSAFFVVLLLAFAIVYTHHLSTFILGYTIIGAFILYIILFWKRLKDSFLAWTKLLLSPLALMLLCSGILMITFVHTPSYLSAETISGSVGAPTKSTRVGLPFAQYAATQGEIRFVLGIVGIIFAIFIATASKSVRAVLRMHYTESTALSPYAIIILAGWPLTLILMTTAPEFMKVNILSSRIAAYSDFPLALAGGFFIASFIALLHAQGPNFTRFTYALTIFLVVSLYVEGLRDSASNLKTAPNTVEAVQTFHSAQYMNTQLPSGVWALKDHNYITADTWMKVFSQNPQADYSNPLSRGFFARYESKPRREHCTLHMISEPSSELARTCFANLNIGPILVRTDQDAGQFERDASFIKVYESDTISTFWRK